MEVIEPFCVMDCSLLHCAAAAQRSKLQSITQKGSMTSIAGCAFPSGVTLTTIIVQAGQGGAFFASTDRLKKAILGPNS